MPSPGSLVKEYARWKDHQTNNDVYKNAIPWITFWTIDYLEEFLNKKMSVFEYGGGGSTLFFASRVAELVTVEHNQEWFSGLTIEMKKNTTVQWTSNMIQPELVKETSNLKIDRPEDYFSDDENFKLHTFKEYASRIDEYPDEHFDIVLVDGRARPSCMLHSLRKVKKNGLLILDNADRTYYLTYFKGKLDNYKLVADYTGPTPYLPWFTQTNVWKRMH